MALDLVTKANIRRHLGLPAAGNPLGGYLLGIRTVTRAGQLEYYMNSLQLEEECILLGQPYAAFQILDPVMAGDTIHVVVTPPNNGTPVIYSQLVTSTDTGQTLCYRIAAGLQLQLTNVFVAPSNGLIPAQISLRSPVGTFLCTAMAVNANGPQTVVMQTSGGSVYPNPQYTIDDGGGNAAAAQIAYGILPVCDALESQLLNSNQNLSFSEVGSTQTGAATFRKDEQIARVAMLQRYRHDLGVMLSFFRPDAISGIPSFGIEV